MSNSTKINKILKKLELEIYAEDTEKADFVRYLRNQGFEKISNAFLVSINYEIIGKVLSDADMLSYNDVIDILAMVAINLK